MEQKHVTIAVAGEKQQGKSALTVSLSRIISEKYGITQAVDYEKIANGTNLDVSCYTPDRYFHFADYSGDDSWIISLMRGGKADGIILVVRDINGISDRFDQYLMVIKDLGIENVFVFINTEYSQHDDELYASLENAARQKIIGGGSCEEKFLDWR